MVAERIDDSSYPPTILVADGPNHGGSRCDGPFEGGIRIFHDHQNSNRTTAERLGAEVMVLRRLIGKPEFGCPYRQPGDDLAALVIDAEQLASSERRLVELDRPHPVSNREHRGYNGLLIAHRRWPLSLTRIRAARHYHS